MKKRIIGILALLSIVLLLSSCDISTLLDNLKGNAYEDILDIDLVGEQAQEAVNTVVEATEPVNESKTDVVEGAVVKVDSVQSVDVPSGVTPQSDLGTKDVTTPDDLEDDKVAVVGDEVPTLPKQTEEQKTELKSTVATALSGEGEDEFVESLSADADDDQVIAAHNTAVIVTSVVNSINSTVASSGLSDEFKEDFSEIAAALTIGLPENPTKADILNVQLASNLVNSMTNALNLIAGAGSIADIDLDSPVIETPEVQEALLGVVSDAAFMVKVAKAQGSTSDLINSIDINNLISMFSSRDAKLVSSRIAIDPDPSTSDETYYLPEESLQYLNGFRGTLDLILRDILGVDPVTNTMDKAKFEAAIKTYKAQKVAFGNFISAARTGKYTYAKVRADDRAVFCGVTGLINYTIAVVLTNIEDVMDVVAVDINDVNYDTIEEIVNLLLSKNTALINADELTTTTPIVSPGIVEDLGDLAVYSDINLAIDHLGVREIARKYFKNAILLVKLGTDKPEQSILLEMLESMQEDIVPTV
ncbi:MAG: hypothetical protein ACPKNR_02335 [Pleomorphochaeta sp.]